MSFCRDKGCQQSDLLHTRAARGLARSDARPRASPRVAASLAMDAATPRDAPGGTSAEAPPSAFSSLLFADVCELFEAIREVNHSGYKGNLQETHAPESFLRAVDKHSGRPAPCRVVRAVPPDAPQRRQGARLVQPEGSGVGSVRRNRARFEAARESRLPRAGGLAQERLGRLRAYRLRGCAEAPARPRGPAVHGGRDKRGARRAVPKKKRRREGGDDARAGRRDGRDADALAR
jgi:hypothetical protein